MFFFPLMAGTDIGGGAQTVAESIALAEHLVRVTGRRGADVLSLAEALQYARLALPLSEPWDVADAAGTLSGNYPWVDYIGGGHLWGVVNRAAQLQGTGAVSSNAQGGRLNVDLGRSDYRLKLRIQEWHDTGAGLLVVGPCARMQGDTSLTFYCPTLIAVNGVVSFALQRFIGGGSVQLGPAIPITPHADMELDVQLRGDLISGYFDDVRLVSQHDPSGILTGRFIGLQGVATLTNRVRVSPLTVSLPGPEVAAAALDTLGLTEALRRQISRPLAETLDLTEAEARQAVVLRGLADALGLTEALTRTVSRPHLGVDTVGLFETLGIELRTRTPQFHEPLTLTETLTPRVTERARAELLALTESLSRVFRGQVHVGVLQMTNESVLVSGASARQRVTAEGHVRVAVPERSALEYTADLIGRGGIIVTAADVAGLSITLYNAADGAIVNQIERAAVNNVGRGTLTDDGHLTITLDAADTPILDPTQPYEHHILLIEGTYDGALRALRREITHVVRNLAKVP